MIGCGRSGTTIFGTSLSIHREVTYLNEFRHLWFSAYPETDIWSTRARDRGGKLQLTRRDAQARQSRKLRRLFQYETLIRRRPVLIEKLPINNFRLDFINEVFPDGRFIHLYRNGMEVAHSIARLSDRGTWFGMNSYKWDKLVEYAMARAETHQLPELCSTYLDKGLLEWRLSTEAAVSFLSQLPPDRFLEISYEDFTADPVTTIASVQDFIGVPDDPKVSRFVRTSVGRKSTRLNATTLPEQARLLGGPLLPLSMDGGRGLTERRPRAHDGAP